jgi:hypothetical protein
MYFTLGCDPVAAVFDKGFAIESVFELNTSGGIATVTYFRGKNQNDSEDRDFLTHDRHGVPRCKHCGSPTSFVRFAAKPYPFLWVQCNRGTVKGACDKPFRLRCSTDWRRLVPLWKTDIIYQELLASHSRYERVHHHWREHYLVAGNDVANRPKRIGIKWQQLRANAALLVEWLGIAWRQGWLGSAKKNLNEPARAAQKIGAEKRKKLLALRAAQNFTFPTARSLPSSGSDTRIRRLPSQLPSRSHRRRTMRPRRAKQLPSSRTSRSDRAPRLSESLGTFVVRAIGRRFYPPRAPSRPRRGRIER